MNEHSKIFSKYISFRNWNKRIEFLRQSTKLYYGCYHGISGTNNLINKQYILIFIWVLK